MTISVDVIRAHVIDFFGITIMGPNTQYENHITVILMFAQLYPDNGIATLHSGIHFVVFQTVPAVPHTASDMKPLLWLQAPGDIAGSWVL